MVLFLIASIGIILTKDNSKDVISINMYAADKQVHEKDNRTLCCDGYEVVLYDGNAIIFSNENTYNDNITKSDWIEAFIFSLICTAVAYCFVYKVDCLKENEN